MRASVRHGNRPPVGRFIDAMNAMGVVLNAEGVILYANPHLAELLDVPRARLEGSPFDQLVAPRTRRLYRRLIETSGSGTGSVGEVTLRRADGTPLYAQISLRRLPPPDPDVIMLVALNITRHQRAVERLRREKAKLEAIVQERTAELVKANQTLQDDIRRREAAEAALRLSEAKWRKLFEVSPAVITLTTLRDGRILEANDAFLRILGYRREEVIGRKVTDLGAWGDPSHRAAWAAELMQRGSVENVEVQVSARAGEVRLGLVSSGLIEMDGDQAVLTVIRDITERKRAEERLRQALADRDTLLREVHHRTKNNLQMLCDLLYLQVGTLHSGEAKNALQDTYGRLFAFARLHEQLYPSLESGQIRLADYVERLVAGFAEVYPVPVRLEAAAPDLALDVDRAIHAGLVANELITNALKHAFPAGTAGEVRVRLRRVGDDVELQVCDGGKGLPPDFDLAQAKTLGLRIVHILAQRLGAAVTVQRGGGTTFTIRFPIRDDN